MNNDNKKIVNGNVATAEGLLRAGCRFFAGYPITPSTDILEDMSYKMSEVGGVFIQAESELAAINMVFGAASAGARAATSTSGPGFSLYQEGISYMAADDIPAIIINVMREGAGLGDIPRSQGDYYQMTKGGGNGDYHCIVLAPNSVKECIEFPKIAFELAEKYLTPVIITYDADIGHTIENASIPEYENHNIDKFDWALKGCSDVSKYRTVQNVYYHNKNYDEYLLNKYKSIENDVQMYEQYMLDDAEYIIVAFGICSRIAKDAVNVARQKNIKLGMIRPITLYPFPNNAFEKLSDVKKIISFELNILGQMAYDIRLAVKNKIPVEHLGKMSVLPSIDEILNSIVNEV